MRAAIIDKLGNKIHGKEIVESASDKDDDDEEIKWRRYGLSFVLWLSFLFRSCWFMGFQWRQVH